MVGTKTPLSLEKNPDNDDAFFTGNDSVEEGHVFVTRTMEDLGIQFPFFQPYEYYQPQEDAISFWRRDFSGIRFSSIRLFDEISFTDHDQGEIYVSSYRPVLHSSILAVDSSYADVMRSINHLFSPPKKVYPAEIKKRVETQRALEHSFLFVLNREFRFFKLKNPSLLKNKSYSDHKKISRCCPSHFWQVIE